MATTVVVPFAELPSVLPTDRLLVNGMCAPELRSELRRIDNRRNALSVLALWCAAIGVVVAAVAVDNPLGYLVAFVAMGPIYVRFAILMHEAAHRLLFSDRRVNDWVGTWVLAYPALVPIALYRRGHLAHHREEFGPEEPDRAFYSGYPCTRRTLWRRLARDAVGISGYKNFKPLVISVRSTGTRRVALSILGMQAFLWAVAWVSTGRWWIYPALWFLPWMTEWRVLNRLRALGEHGGLVASSDRRRTTHNVRQTWLARLWLVPYHTGWHLAHHVDIGIPWRNLPRFHAELVRAGYVTELLTYRSYTSLWRTLASKASLARPGTPGPGPGPQRLGARPRGSGAGA